MHDTVLFLKDFFMKLLHIGVLACLFAANVSGLTAMAHLIGKEVQKEDICTICGDICKKDEQGAQEARTVSCGHVFHTGCIGNWFFRRLSCPNCRRIEHNMVLVHAVIQFADTVAAGAPDHRVPAAAELPFVPVGQGGRIPSWDDADEDARHWL